jgi:FixJ family two-component response regulator
MDAGKANYLHRSSGNRALRNVVFVVDDDPGTLRAIGRLLRQHGYATMRFPSAEAFENHRDFRSASFSTST